MTATDEVRVALAVYGSHAWNATSQKCNCGDHFEASLTGHKLHDEHRMAKVLEAVSGNKLTADDLYNFTEDLKTELRATNEALYSARNGIDQKAQELSSSLSRTNEAMGTLGYQLRSR